MSLIKKSNILKNTNSTLIMIIVIGILAVINFFSYQIFYRWDITENKDFSISKVSKKTVSELDDIVSIKVYFSDDLPSQYINLRQEVGDILEEYANYSNNNIRIEFIDPRDDDDLKRRLYMIGIPELQFNVLEKDKWQVVKGYLGIAIQYGDNTEVIPVVEDTRDIEYRITLGIKKTTGKIKSVVGFLSSNSALSAENEMSSAYKKVSELYQSEQVNLEAEEEILKSVNTLVIAGPREKFSEKELKAIDSFLMRGGSILMLLDGVSVGEGLSATKNDLGIDNLLKSYGINFNHDLVLDVSSGMASFTQGFMTFSLNYPLWPKVIKQGFDQNNAAVSKLESMIFPWASSMEVINDIVKGNTVSYLARTTSKAWAQNENYDLNPQQMFIQGGETKERNLAVSIFGNFSSPYNQGSVKSGRLIVVGDSDFISDSFAQRSPDNIIFFQNLVDSLSLEEDLINIRSEGITDRPTEELDDSEKAAIRYGNIFGITVVVVAFGIFRYYRRRRGGLNDEL